MKQLKTNQIIIIWEQFSKEIYIHVFKTDISSRPSFLFKTTTSFINKCTSYRIYLKCQNFAFHVNMKLIIYLLYWYVIIPIIIFLVCICWAFANYCNCVCNNKIFVFVYVINWNINLNITFFLLKKFKILST